MNTDERQIRVQSIPVDVVRKDIKNVHLAVYPPHGRVRIAVPLRLSDQAVRLAVVDRIAWIRKQQSRFNQQERQSQREMVTGESQYVEGRRYRLKVVENGAQAGIYIRRNATLEINISPSATVEQRRLVLDRWYREQLRSRIPALLEKWEPLAGVKVESVGIKKMKTRWGSCNRDAHRIWVNLELAKKPPGCLEYIVLHEMAHILERHHNERFQGHMDRLMPNWRRHRDELNRAPLSHHDWAY